MGSETALIIYPPWNCLWSATTVSRVPAFLGLGCCLPFSSLLGGESNASVHYRTYRMLSLMWKYRPDVMSQLTDGTVSVPKTLQPQCLTGMTALRAQKCWSLRSCQLEMPLGIWHSHTTPLLLFTDHFPPQVQGTFYPLEIIPQEKKLLLHTGYWTWIQNCFL